AARESPYQRRPGQLSLLRRARAIRHPAFRRWRHHHHDPGRASPRRSHVAQNISALNLNLSGNLTVSGGVSSPSTLSAPQQGSAAPVQIGPHWYAGTASGQCIAPGAPAVVVETISSGTGTIGTASYQYKVALYNR